MFKLKFILATAALLLAGSGVAFAATGHVPELVKSFTGSLTATGDQYTKQEKNSVEDQYSRAGVSEIAKDKSATGTMTIPNGKEIENHGLAVSQTAKAQHDDEEKGDQYQKQAQQGEDNSGSQSQKHENGENGTSTSQPPASTSHGGQHNKP